MTKHTSIDGSISYIERDGKIENALDIAKLNNIPFIQILANEHRGKLRNYLIDTIAQMKFLKKEDMDMAIPYPCGIRYYQKCLREFNEVYDIDTFETDYPEWCI